jgi:hypothetical protein
MKEADAGFELSVIVVMVIIVVYCILMLYVKDVL